MTAGSDNGRKLKFPAAYQLAHMLPVQGILQQRKLSRFDLHFLLSVAIERL